MPWYAPSGAGTGGTTNARLNITGSVANAAGLPANGTAGQAYITRDTGHLWVHDGTQFIDAGLIGGPAGPAPFLVGGTTTRLAPDSDPTATLVMTSANRYRLDLGLPGAPAMLKQAYTYTQSSAAGTWVFSHDLEFTPAGLRITDADNPDVSWNVAVTYDAPNKTFTIRFPVAVRGAVTVS